MRIVSTVLVEEVDSKAPQLQIHLVVPRYVCRYVDDKPRIVRTDDIEEMHVKVGGTVVSWAGAPGTGMRICRIVRIDRRGAWGYVEKDTIRVIEPEEAV